MSSGTFNFNTIEHFILSPGDIYWIKKSGEETLVSKKGDVLNTILCQKLVKGNYVLKMTDAINVEIISMLEECFASSKKELLIQKKNQLRKKIIDILRVEYAETERSQFEFDIMAWKIFSQISQEEQLNLVSIDIDLFKRALRVTSSLVMTAFLVGYYDENFLEALYTRTLKLLMGMVTPETLSEDIKKFEEMRKDVGSEKSVTEDVKFLFDRTALNSELSSWEKLLVAFNLHYPFDADGVGVNILSELCNNKIGVNANEFKTARGVLIGANNGAQMVELT